MYAHKCMCVKEISLLNIWRDPVKSWDISLSLVLWWKLTFWVLPGFFLFSICPLSLPGLFAIDPWQGFTSQEALWKRLFESLSEWCCPSQNMIFLLFYHTIISAGLTYINVILIGLQFPRTAWGAISGGKSPICNLLSTFTLAVFRQLTILCFARNSKFRF